MRSRPRAARRAATSAPPAPAATGDRGIKNNATGGPCRVNFDYFDMKRPEESSTDRNGKLEYQRTSYGGPDSMESTCIVNPKHPHLSSVIWRLKAVNDDVPPADTSQWPFSAAFDIPQDVMPPPGGGGRFQADSSALKVLADWINSLPEDPMVGVLRGSRSKPTWKLRVAGNLIHVDGLTDIPSKAWLVDTRGKRRAVTAAGPGRYRLPEGMAPGVYHLVLGTNRTFRILFPGLSW